MHKKNSSISAILISLNEEKNIARCLESVSFCNEIIVIDGGSSDKTIEIGKSFGAKVELNTQWQGFGTQKSIALSRASSDWVLSIDADEVVSPELKLEILQAIDQDRINGFFINRLSNFLGHWMRHGGWRPDYILRLARRNVCQFDLAPIHEKMIVNGPTGYLHGKLLHYSYPTIDKVLAKQARYALDSAREKSGPRGSGYSVASAMCRSMFKFIQLYIVRLGFLDGTPGLLAAISKSQETFWKYAAVRFLTESQEDRFK
jgi:glycosyltransferase involved in cell wall biosynthesis